MWPRPSSSLFFRSASYCLLLMLLCTQQNRRTVRNESATVSPTVSRNNKFSTESLLIRERFTILVCTEHCFVRAVCLLAVGRRKGGGREGPRDEGSRREWVNSRAHSSRETRVFELVKVVGAICRRHTCRVGPTWLTAPLPPSGQPLLSVHPVCIRYSIQLGCV